MRRRIAARLAWTVLGGAAVGGLSTAVVLTTDSVSDITNPNAIGVVRFGRVASTATTIFADYKWNLYGKTGEEYDRAISQAHQRSAERLLDLARRNGGVFIKVGQHLSALEHLVPPEYTKTLSVLHSNAPRSSLQDVRSVIETELQKKIEDVFSSIEDQPVGAASLAQVHIGVLRDSGRKVALKVQHRHVLARSRSDVRTMELFVRIAGHLFPEFRLVWLVDEVKRNMPQELDFRHEAENIERVRHEFKHVRFLKVPEVYHELTTDKLLAMEYCEGAFVNDVARLRKEGVDLREVCRKLGRLFSEMIFERGLIHCDPHPGNILVRKDSSGSVQLVLLDHGLYLRLSDEFRSLYTKFWMALLKPDQDEIKRIATQMGVGELYGLFACMVSRRSWRAVTSGIAQNEMTRDEKAELLEWAATLLPQISQVLQKMPREMILILKTNDLLRHLEHELGMYRRATAMVELTKCVVRSHYAAELARPQCGFVSRLRLYFLLAITLLKLRVAQVWLIAQDLLARG